MEQQFSTKDTKEVLVFAFKFAGVIKAASADGKIDFNDMGLFFTIIPSLGPAFDNISNIPKELKELSPGELGELENLVATELGALITKEKLVAQINAGLKLIHSMHEFYISLK